MAFRFSLAAVLRLREIHEQREERKLGEIHARINHTREEIAAIEQQILQVGLKREQQLLDRMSATELNASYGTVAALKEWREAARKQLLHLEQLRDEQINVYRAAHQSRQVLTNMRQEQREAFLAEQSRREQKGIDDLFIARMRRQ